MVIVVCHILVAELLNRIWKRGHLFIRNLGRFSKMGITDGMQEAILRLSGVVTFEQLEETLKDALELALPNVSDAIVYIRSQEGQELFSSQGLIHTLPKEGLPWEAVQRRERLVVDGLDAADPMSGLLKSGNSPLPASRKVANTESFGHAKHQVSVVCSPVVDRENDRVLGVFLVVCDQLSSEDNHHLSFIEKQLLVCYRRLKQSSLQLSNHTSILNATPEKPHSDNAILNLCADLYDQDAASLQLKVIHYLVTKTQAQSGFLLLVDLVHRELFCQVIGDKVLEEEIRFPLDQNSFSTVVQTKEPISLEDIQDDHREELEECLGYKVHSFLCAPVCNRVTGDVVAICCMVNKTKAQKFTDDDMTNALHCFKFTATVLHSTLAVQNERKLKNQTQALLQVARNLFTQLDDLTRLLREIMQEARNLTKAERCSVFLLEKESNELVAKVFDGDIRDQKEKQEPLKEVRIPADSGIAGYVNTTGELLNIDDAYSHPLFYRGVDESTGFRTRNILCFPIKDEQGQVIGVAQLCNKINGVGFSSFDEEIAQAFSVYCCISIVHSLLYKKVREAQSRNKLSNELMIYHMQVQNEEVGRLTEINVPDVEEFSTLFPNFDQFYYTPRCIPYDQTVLAVFFMFEDMGFITKYRIQRDYLARFVLMVRKGYRDPPYHNWAHAFAVAHFCYLMYKNLNLLNYIDEIECFALFVACLCHDIDHRGTTNSYQVASDSVLATLYSSEGSVLERHHFAQSMCILNTDGCNIFENLSKKEYETVLDLMRDIILATDLAHHLRIVKDLEHMAEGTHQQSSDGYCRTNKKHKVLMLCLLMTSCDLSDQTKHWQNSKTIAELIYQEFFSQGDLEKTLGRSPLDMMDRDKAHIPELQVGFLNGIALPVFRILGKIFKKATVVTHAVENNKRMWLRLNEKLKQTNLSTNMDMFNLEIEEEMDETLGEIVPVIKNIPKPASEEGTDC